jgi:hypothetical protein
VVSSDFLVCGAPSAGGEFFKYGTALL